MALFALLEDLSLLELGFKAALVLVAACVSGLFAWYALWRYLGMLVQAQRLSERSTCTRCGTYGRYRLVRATVSSMTVSCRKCENEWTIA